MFNNDNIYLTPLDYENKLKILFINIISEILIINQTLNIFDLEQLGQKLQYEFNTATNTYCTITSLQILIVDLSHHLEKLKEITNKLRK